MKFPLLFLASMLSTAAAADYAVVVSSKTAADEGWARVTAKLVERHRGAEVIRWEKSPADALPGLKSAFPRYVCFVAPPTETTAEFVAEIHRLTRKLDDDPYTDVFWGILTGHDAQNALAIASESAPLTVKKALSGTELALDRIPEGRCFDELKKGHSTQRKAGEAPAVVPAPDDTTEALVRALNEDHPDLMVTSGHATERDWQIGFRYRNGYFRSRDGAMTGHDTAGAHFSVSSLNPKVYLPIGNCLMGHIDGPDAMALAWMKSAGVRQMIGYTKPTWFGYMGWGMLDYFVEQPGRFTLAEAFVANQAALVHRLSERYPAFLGVEKVDDMARCLDADAPATAKDGDLNEGNGLLFDRDVVAFYGDPAWEARVAPGPRNWEQKLTLRSDGGFTLEIEPGAGAKTFTPVDTNGSQRGGRPIVQFFPRRLDVGGLRVTVGAELKPVVTDTFVLVPLPPAEAPVRPLTVEFAPVKQG